MMMINKNDYEINTCNTTTNTTTTTTNNNNILL